VSAPEPAPARWKPRLNVVYTADRPTYVTAQYTGGFSGSVSLLVGPDDVPTQRVGELSPVFNSFVAALVRAGERWTLSCAEAPKRGGLLCWATPLDGDGDLSGGTARPPASVP
jgi:hypothetical protein